MIELPSIFRLYAQKERAANLNDCNPLIIVVGKK